MYFRSNRPVIHLFVLLINTYLLPSFSNAIAMRSLVRRNISIIRIMASTTESEITAKHTHSKWISVHIKGFKYREKCEVNTHWKWAMSDWAAGRRWSLSGSRCQRWWYWCPLSHSGSCTPRSNARYLWDRRSERAESIWIVRGGVGCVLTVADSSDHPKDEEPEEHVSGVAQQQDEEQTDHHGYHQSTAAIQTPEDHQKTHLSVLLSSNQEVLHS